MASVDPQSLQIHPDAADPLLAQQQERFNQLVLELAASRVALAEWKDRTARYQQVVEPVRRELHGACRQWVFALDHASLQPGLTRAERRQLVELLHEALAPLLEGEEDAQIAALAARHAEAPSLAAAQEDASVAHDGEEEPIDDPADDWERQAAAAAAQRAEWAAQRRAGSALKRRRQQEQEVSQSVRDVYRRLASALHPDREPDAAQRARKTTLMQRANQAYAEQNLLELLELRMQAEQIDAAHLSTVDRGKLQHYVTVLQEQLADLQAETRRLEAAFRAATGAAPGSGLQPRKADRMISAEAQRLRGDLQLLRRQTSLLLDEEATRQWLREQRRV